MNKPKAHSKQHSTTIVQHTKFHWWYAVILVAVVAIVGISVIQFSRAFGGGRVYVSGGDSGPYVEYDINLDGSVNLKESISGSTRNNVPYNQAQTVGLQMVNEALVKQNAPAATSSPAATDSSASTASQQSPNTSSSTAENTSTQTTTTTEAEQTATTSTTQSSSSTAEQLGDSITLSGVQVFQLASSQLADVVSVEYFIGETSIGSSTTSPFSITYDTHLLSNGPHTLRAVAQRSSTPIEYQLPLSIKNTQTWWQSILDIFR